ncbi:dTMP kinase [Boudabousia liubingyangii]|uniref:dTMP kinase n=1 Tax=Boudabousia liubingyangii TaxID=1921764 RepID=UPI0009390304|nr:dTMP kinase [Boudabousia liubingyangii]OKL46878.1 dTMP kinase [Boudabousia liubingyangii]
MSLSIPNVTDQAANGLFISFEGGEAVGKTTQIRLLTEQLESEGYQVVSTREPGGTDLGNQLRNLVQHGPEDVNPKCEALLYAADRSYHVATKIRPALEAGKVVITDRYLDSSIAYQGGARGLGEDVENLSRWATDGLMPHVTFLLDANPEDVHSRRDGATDRLERESLTFHQAVRERFLELAAAEPGRILVLDALSDPEAIAAQIWQHLNARLTDGRHQLVKS